MRPADEELKQYRRQICVDCGHLARFANGKELHCFDRCRVCGCFVKAKTAFMGLWFRCPKGKW